MHESRTADTSTSCPGASPHRVLVFDFGTTSLKAAIVEDEEILAETNTSYPVSAPHSGWAEQDPHQLWDVAGTASRTLLKECEGTRPSVTSVVFIAPWKAIIPVSATGEVLRPAMIWLDNRAQSEATALNNSVGEFVGTGQEIWPRLMWLKRHEPDIWQSSRWLMGLVTYFKWRATGHVVTEPSDDFIASPARAQQERYDLILKHAGLDEDRVKFPPSRASSAVIGQLTADAAAHFGVPVGTAVHGGFGDLPAITVGAGTITEGAAHLYIGTSSWFAVVTDQVDRLAPPLSFNLDVRHRVALYPLQTAGMAFDWIVQELYGYEQVHLDEELLDRVNRDITEVPAGSDRLLATHWLNGELPPLDKTARGAFINLTPAHDRRHMVRAMMESLCYTHRISVETYEEASGQSVEEIVCTGGGAASDAWMQMMADVLGKRIVVPRNPRYTGVIGGYRTSIAGTAGAATTVASAHKERRFFEPDPDGAAVYNEMFGYYNEVYPALRKLFARMNG